MFIMNINLCLHTCIVLIILIYLENVSHNNDTLESRLVINICDFTLFHIEMRLFKVRPIMV